MLEFVKIKHADQIRNLLKDFNPNQQTWIVSDLKSKQEIQNECVQKFGFFTDDSILRISDFWRIWIRRFKPTVQVVASDFIKSLVQVFMSNHSARLGLSENDTSTLERYVQELAPIILHPESHTLLSEWLVAQEDLKKWQKWYAIARVCVLFIVTEKKVIDVKWSAAFLQSIDLEKFKWPYELIVDLGTELTSIEMGLFKTLSQKQNVQIYVPSPSWQERFPFLLKTYSENLGYGQTKELTLNTVVQTCKKEFIRLSTQLSEIKFAVATARQWLDEGVAPERISIIAIQIEEYWPVLESYLSEEGILYQKDIVASVNSLANVQVFLAHLNSLSSQVNFESLQQKFFQNNSNPEIKFEKFKALFNQLYDEEDLKRNDKIKSNFYKKVDFTQAVSRDDFFSLLIRIWTELPENDSSVQLFEFLFKDLLSQSLETQMKLSNWFQFLKARLSHKELKVGSAHKEGIQVLSLMSAQMSKTDHRIYLGLYEEAFKVQRKSMLPLKDIETLKNQFDLAIPYPEESHLDFNLRWQVESQCEKIVLTTPHLSFTSEPLTACLYFLENSATSEIVNPPKTRSDELQQNLAFFNGEDVLFYEKQVSKKRLQQDMAAPDLVVKHEVFHQLAVSEVETYAQCSFKLLASKGFRLRDVPEVSIDLDPRQKGTLAHSLFEYMVKNCIDDVLDLVAVKAFLETKRTELELFFNEDHFWGVQQNKLVALAAKFHEFEKIRRKKFKSLTEVAFEMHFEPQAKTFSTLKTPTSLTIRGRIDRLDQNLKENYYLIYDYKASSRNAKNYSKWMDEYQFQLLLYILAVETSLFEEASVKGALYYLYKNFDVTKGLVESKVAFEDLDFLSKKNSLIEREKIESLKIQFIDFIAESLTGLQNGEFRTAPFELKICEDCDWRKLCRAQHLM